MRPCGELGITLDNLQEAATLGEVVAGACELLGAADPLRLTLDGVAAAAREQAAGYEGAAEEFRFEIPDTETAMVLVAIIWSAGANHDDPAVRDRADNMIASYEMRKYGPKLRVGSAGPFWEDKPAA